MSTWLFVTLCLIVLFIYYATAAYFRHQHAINGNGEQDENGRDLGYAGKYLRTHEPSVNINTLINTLTGAPRALLAPSAVIVQQKKFPDVSFWQGEINWDVMREKTDAVIIRAGQNIWEDKQFKRNWAEAKRVGMRRGCYFFDDDRVSPGKQAELLVSLIKDDLPEMEVFVDWENSYGGNYQGLSNVVVMMKAVEKALPTVTVGIYTGWYWWIENTNPITNALQYIYLKSKPLWQAWYTKDLSTVKVISLWPRLTHIQWGTPAVGEEWGVQTQEIDMNYFNGTETEFALRYGGVLPDEPPPNGVTMWYRVTATSGLQIRKGPGLSYTDIGDLLLDDVIEVTETLGGWHHFKSAHRGAVALALVDPVNSWCSAAYTVVTDAPIPPVEIAPPDYIVAHWIATGKTTKYIPE